MSCHPRALGSQARRHQASQYFSYLDLRSPRELKRSAALLSKASTGTMYQMFSGTTCAAMKSMLSLV